MRPQLNFRHSRDRCVARNWGRRQTRPKNHGKGTFNALPLCRHKILVKGLDHMTYEEKRYSTKPATRAGYLNGLIYRLQKDPTDTAALDELLIDVYTDEGQPAVLTPEDFAQVIKDAQEMAALPESNIPWPDESDHTIEAAALRAQARRLWGMPDEMIEELAWQHEHPEPKPDWWLAIEAGPTAQEPAPAPTAQEPAATEPEPNTKLCCAVDHGTGCASRIYHGTDCPGAESCPVKQYEDEKCEQENAEMEAGLRRNREDVTAQEPAATNPEPGPAALVFNSLAEYKRWAASASQQERETYWNSLSDLDFARLAEDLDQEEED
jgi:hypothetical protein